MKPLNLNNHIILKINPPSLCTMLYHKYKAAMIANKSTALIYPCCHLCPGLQEAPRTPLAPTVVLIYGCFTPAHQSVGQRTTLSKIGNSAWFEMLVLSGNWHWSHWKCWSKLLSWSFWRYNCQNWFSSTKLFIVLGRMLEVQIATGLGKWFYIGLGKNCVDIDKMYRLLNILSFVLTNGIGRISTQIQSILSPQVLPQGKSKQKLNLRQTK